MYYIYVGGGGGGGKAKTRREEASWEADRIPCVCTHMLFFLFLPPAKWGSINFWGTLPALSFLPPPSEGVAALAPLLLRVQPWVFGKPEEERGEGGKERGRQHSVMQLSVAAAAAAATLIYVERKNRIGGFYVRWQPSRSLLHVSLPFDFISRKRP